MAAGLAVDTLSILFVALLPSLVMRALRRNGRCFCQLCFSVVAAVVAVVVILAKCFRPLGW